MQLKQHRVAIGVVGVALVVVIALIIPVVWFNGTGFDGYNQVTTAHTISGPSAGTVVRTEVYQPGKSLWDRLQLLIIPVVLAVGALLFNLATTRTEQKIASDKQREDLLQAYLDRMSELLLKDKLRSSAVDAEVRNVARVRTITILIQLDVRRVGYVFAFLREAGLISNQPNKSIVNLSRADLSKVNWSQATLKEADLNGANLKEADLSGANLGDTYLGWAHLEGADLKGAFLSEANLSNATLRETNLSYAYLYKADFSHAYLKEADLSKAYLEGANFSNATISQANLTGARGITIEELEKQAKSLAGAIMPDGSKHA